MDARQERGMMIAAKYRIIKAGNSYSVPSASINSTKYTVNPNAESPSCTCLDHTERGVKCKHMWAASYVIEREEHDDGSTTFTETVTVQKKTTYKQDWPNYNAAQTNELSHFQAFLADLCSALPTPPAKRGQQPIPPCDAAFCAVFKTYSTMSARRFNGDLENAQEQGFITRVPHFNSVLNFLDREESTPILEQFVTQSASPLTAVEERFATDSTGFSGCRYVRWFDEKYGVPRMEIEWLKLHATVGVRTNVITACKVTPTIGDSGDATQFPELARKTAEQFTIKEMSADKAYASQENCETMEEIGGQFYPAFKKNATGGIGGAFQKVFHLMSLNQEEYMAHYHQRSNVESTFSAMKRKFGETLRSKTDVAMKNEILAKVVCHNISCVIHAMYELGIKPGSRSRASVVSGVLV
jgi:hypothetical protein